MLLLVRGINVFTLFKFLLNVRSNQQLRTTNANSNTFKNYCGSKKNKKNPNIFLGKIQLCIQK